MLIPQGALQCFSQCPYLAGFMIHVLQDEVNAELVAHDRNRICDVILDKVAARSPIREKHKGLEVKRGNIRREKQFNPNHTAPFN